MAKAIETLSGSELLQLQSLLGIGLPAATLPALTVDLNFASGEYRAGGQPVSLGDVLQVTRAVGSRRVPGADGVYRNFAADTAAVVDGALVAEPPLTNLVRNPVLAGGTAGSIGTDAVAPTNMSFAGGAGLTTRTVAYGTENGLEYAELTLSGTSTSTLFFNFEANNSMAAGSGQHVLLSAPLRWVSGTWPTNSAVSLNVAEKDSAGADLGAATGRPVNTAPAGITVLPVYRRFSSGTAAYAAAYLRLGAGTYTNLKFRVYLPTLTVGRVGAPLPVAAGAVLQAEALAVRVPNGTYDVLVTEAFGQSWYTGQSVTGGVWTLPIPDGVNRPARFARVQVYTTGAAETQRRAAENVAAGVQLVDARRQLDAQVDGLLAVGPNTYERSTIEQPYAIQRLPGRNLFRFECRPGDGSKQGAGTDRSELVGYWSGANTYNILPFNTDVWWSYSMLVTGALPTNTSEWCLVGQWHQLASDAGDASLSPPLSFSFVGRQFRISTAHDSAVQQTNSTNINLTSRYEDNAYPLGKWVSFVGRARFSYSAAAELQVWRDGAQILNLSGINMGFNDALGAGRYQFGLYRAQNYSTALAAVYANMEVSPTTLAARVAAPLPVPTISLG